MSDGEPRDGANVEFAPPLVPVIALGVGLILQHLVWTLAVPLAGYTQYAAGGLLIVAGLGLMMVVAATWAAIYKVAIQHEEAYLEQKFGTSYLAYKDSVRRWL
jgi:hypothetical protein